MSRMNRLTALSRLLLALLSVASFPEAARSGPTVSGATPPPECVQYVQSWTPCENVVWEQICRTGYFGGADVSNPKCFPGRLQVSGEFLAAVLTQPQFSKRIAEKGLRLENADIVPALSLDDSTISGDITLIGIQTDSLAITGATINGKLTVSSSNIEHVELNQSHFNQSITISNSWIRYLRLLGSVVDHNLEISDIELQPPEEGNIIDVSTSLIQNLNIDSVQADALTARQTVISGNAKILKSKLKILSADEADIGNLLTINSVDVDRVFLNGARVGGSLHLSGSCLGKLYGAGMTITKTLSISPLLDFRGEVSIDGCPTGWKDPSELNLDGAHVGSIAQSPLRLWPKSMILNGIVIDGFQPWRADAFPQLPPQVRDLSGESPDIWYRMWLGKTHGYDPAPYQQVINYLQKTGGESSLVDEIYIADKTYQRRQECGHWVTFPSCLYLWAASFVGYGRMLWRAIVASIIFIIMGAYIFSRQEKILETDIPLRWAYSFDMFIPLVKLRDRHYKDIDFKGRIRYYLYIHKLAGWILGTLIVASIVSLTK